MIQKIKLLLFQFSLFDALRLMFANLMRRLFDSYSGEFYSQTGEDIIISRVLGNAPGFYIDVGCHHPIRLSNTFYMYKKGWKGIVIDANPKLIEAFRKRRRRDIALCEAVSDESRDAEFYEFKQSAVSTLDTTVIASWKGKWDFVDKRIVRTKTLNHILTEQQDNIPETIDLLSVDVEGHDFNVLKSIDLSIYRPRLIVVEIHDLDLERVDANEIYTYLKASGYKLVGYITMNAYFKDAGIQS